MHSKFCVINEHIIFAWSIVIIPVVPRSMSSQSIPAPSICLSSSVISLLPLTARRASTFRQPALNI